jgi:hypothetical protein
MRTTLTLDDDVYQAALHLSRVSGERLGKTLSTLVRRSLTSTRPQPKGKARRFPAFEVPPGTRIIPASRAERLIEILGA